MAESRDPGWPGRSQFNMGQSFLDRMSDSARKRYMESMMAGIMELGMDGQNSDIEIIVEGQSFPCHKILLAAGAFHKFPTFTLTLLLCVAMAAYIIYVEINIPVIENSNIMEI